MRENHIKFIKHIRTHQFWGNRLINNDSSKGVFIPKNEIQNNFFPYPKFNINDELKYLISLNEIEISSTTLKNGNMMFLYKAKKSGSIDLGMIKNNSNPLDSTTKKMMNYLNLISLPEDAPSTLYFDTFLFYRKYNLELFFTVDKFSGRVHTPVSSFHRTHRPNILINNERTISFDVATMQPLLLAKILRNQIGKNDFTSWIESGLDVYELLKSKLNLEQRDDAKKKFFEILFSHPNNKLAESFGNAKWIEWINEFKSKPFEQNPHSIEKNHSDLAYLLQSIEVNLMRQLWNKLIENDIVFLSVHDEIIVPIKDEVKAFELFNNLLKNEFPYYKINSK